MKSQEPRDSNSVIILDDLSTRLSALESLVKERKQSSSKTGPDSANVAEEKSSPGADSQPTFSQLGAKILDQLSISAWLPAAILVFIVVLVTGVAAAKFDTPGNASNYHVLKQAIKDIGGMDLQSLILLIGSMVLVTTLTQAFEFAAIRFFEGYWGSGRFLGLLGRALSHLHLVKKRHLATRKKKLAYAAFAKARLDMLDRGIERWKVDILENKLHGRSLQGEPQEKLDEALKLDWFLWARPGDVRRLDAMELRSQEFPKNHRILPTRLGNILRAVEDRVFDPSEGRLEGAVRRIFHLLPVPIQSAHDQYRARLDLYCSLTLVFAFSAIGIPVTWAFLPGWTVEKASALAVGVVLALLSYRAAIASAKRYVETLWDIHEELTKRPAEID
jgi:hypothetical protein